MKENFREILALPPPLPPTKEKKFSHVHLCLVLAHYPHLNGQIPLKIRKTFVDVPLTINFIGIYHLKIRFSARVNIKELKS